MKVHVLRNRHRTSRAGIGLHAVEWCFLLFGLAAVDVYVWINASTALYQAYDDWAFDQKLRALSPSPLGFVGEEIRALVGRDQAKAERPEPAPSPKPSETNPPWPSGVIGRLEIPNLQLSVIVREGADAATLRRAVGHIPGTPLPGRTGNVGLAGHRDTFFRALRNIRRNDPIELQTENGTYRYVVESTRIVVPRDVGVLASSGAASLTLVTCYPFYYVGSAPKRFIVHAALVRTGLERLRTPGS